MDRTEDECFHLPPYSSLDLWETQRSDGHPIVILFDQTMREQQARISPSEQFRAGVLKLAPGLRNSLKLRFSTHCKCPLAMCVFHADDLGHVGCMR